MSAIGPDESSENLLDDLARHYASAHRRERPRVLAAFVDLLLELGRAADKEPATLERAILERIGNAPDFVLKGTLQQQVACKVATHLGLQKVNEIPRFVRNCVVIPLIKALVEVLSLGAPTTRDAAVEGLGALLRLVDDPAAQIPSTDPLPVVRETGETDEDYDRRSKISKHYFARLERRRLMVLTIAGHKDSGKQFCQNLKEPINDKLAQFLTVKAVPWGSIEHTLNEHSDLLRILPAMARQGRDLPPDATDLLCAAARVIAIGEDAPSENLVALARFQESVFRTIDAALRRPHHWKWEDFDEAVAGAIRAIPQSIGGPPSVCNGQIRATVAILRTAISLVMVSGGSSRTKESLQPLFRDIGKHMRWSNLGIVEGCYRGLPELITKSLHNDLTGPALGTLFAQLRHPHKSEDPVEIHRHLIANACFRRMLISVAARDLKGKPSEALKVERQLRELLRDPTPENVLQICQRDEDVMGWPAAVMPTDVAHTIIAGIAFESELLHRSASIFHKWDSLLTVDKVLLTRILGAQLHAISRDAPEMKSHPALLRIFSGIPSISMTDAEVMDATWRFLASLPSGAAEAADAEVQRFVEYRGWESDGLPGYVLAMISPAASGRIAGAIAREIDLNLRRELGGGKPFDLAKLLHQVMLRGPHESIFDHLLPRIRGDNDRDTVRLFRKHVANVLHTKQSGKSFDVADIRKHLKSLLSDLRGQASPTLQKLRESAELFVKLTANKTSVWKYSTEQVITLFATLDELALDGHPESAPAENCRARLTEVFRERLSELQEEVAYYVSMPVGDFGGRKTTLKKAAAIAADIEKSLASYDGLQPPESILLIALMQHFRSLFDRTIRCYCDAARQFKDANDPQRFWLYFCDMHRQGIRIDGIVKLELIACVRELVACGRELIARREELSGRVADLIARVRELIASIKEQRARVKELIEGSPPRFSKQRAKFEEYFVEWRSSELDIDSLKNVLQDRWPPWFRSGYKIITNFWLTSLLILLPCGIAIVTDYMSNLSWKGAHSWEGAGFFVITFGIIVAALLSFTQVIHVLAKLRRPNKAREKPGYWFPCLLPRLARLTAVPMALIVEFDHSYEFPLGGSTWALLLLMITSFVTTRFFVTRELVDRKEQPGVVKITRPERRRVRQIVGLALAHSFVIAVLLSAILAPSYERRQSPRTDTVVKAAAGANTPAAGQGAADAKTSKKVKGAAGATTSTTVERGADATTSTKVPSVVAPSSFWKLPVAILDYLDATSTMHPRRRFLGLLPREVSFDVGGIAEQHGYLLPPRIREIVGFRFYPTIILSWTALGLFFGVFLEGFMKGERLRGGVPRVENRGWGDAEDDDRLVLKQR